MAIIHLSMEEDTINPKDSMAAIRVPIVMEVDTTKEDIMAAEVMPQLGTREVEDTLGVVLGEVIVGKEEAATVVPGFVLYANRPIILLIGVPITPIMIGMGHHPRIAKTNV